MKKYSIILISIICVVLIAAICIGVFEGRNNQENIDSRQEFIISYLEKINNTLNLNNTEKYMEVGIYENENLYAFSRIPYTEFKKRFTQEATEEFLKNEMGIRDFYSLRNNIVFTNTEKQQENRKLLMKDNTEFKQMDFYEVMDNVPEFNSLVEKYQTEDSIQNISFYKTMYNSEDCSQSIEVIYMIGEKEDNLILLNSVYYVNGEKYHNVKKWLRQESIAGFTPLTFEESSPNIDLGNQDAIIEREENYQGSKPYYEQNFEENNKVFER